MNIILKMIYNRWNSQDQVNISNKENFQMINELGKTIAKVAQTVPGGMLVFFPSYRMMETSYDYW